MLKHKVYILRKIPYNNMIPGNPYGLPDEFFSLEIINLTGLI